MKKIISIVCLSLLFVVITQAQNSNSYIDYSDTYTMSEEIVQSNSISAVCTGQREDISELDANAQSQLADLILQYLTSVENPMYNPAIDHPAQKYTIVAEHSNFGGDASAWHSNDEVFFSWHRDYIQGLENWLLEQGYPEFVPLPAWNPNQPIPSAFQDAVVPEVLSTNSMELGNIQQGQLNMYEVDDITCEQFANMNHYAGFIRAGISNPTGTSFTSHNAVHGTIGGAMGFVETASAAAIFWLFHAHVDELYQCYQTYCQDCEPVFIRATHEGRGCDYCFDFSLNVNVDEITVTLIDENGIETILPWSPSRTCIPSTFLESGQSYTARIEGNNSTSEGCSAKDEVEIEFTAPLQPSRTKFIPNPCLQVQQEPQFPTTGFHPNNGGGTKSFIVKNIGDIRSFTFYNTVVQSGFTNQIGSSIELQNQEEILIIIPNQYVGYGNNYFFVEVGGGTSETQYFITN